MTLIAPSQSWVAQKKVIEVLGPNKLQNNLLASYLKQETGTECSCASRLTHLDHSISRSVRVLVLFDCFHNDLNEVLWNKFNPGGELHLPNYYVALFNVAQASSFVQKKALRCGIRGVFATGESLQGICKGVKAIMEGELWFSRDSLSGCIVEYENILFNRENILSDLTPREKEILLRIASGERNKKIADDLCISPYTVKTHVHNIYQKINVTNRLGASRWVARHFKTVM